MSRQSAPILTRDDPDQDPLVGNTKVTREDWLNRARDVLVNEGVGELKILKISNQLEVSRSSFYWYFKDRADLLNALLDEWESRNTNSIVSQCKAPARCVTEGLLNFFRCFVDPTQFDPGLDFAVREWARRDSAVRTRIDAADAARLQAVIRIFSANGFSDYESQTRARIVYFMQLGYHALELRESIQVRLSRLEGYLLGFTGVEPARHLIDEFAKFSLGALPDQKRSDQPKNPSS